MLDQTIPIPNQKSNNSSRCRLRRLLRYSVVRYNIWLPLSPPQILQHPYQLHPPPLLLLPPPFLSPQLASPCVQFALSLTDFETMLDFQLMNSFPLPAV